MGIEPTQQPWQGCVLPLNYIRKLVIITITVFLFSSVFSAIPEHSCRVPDLCIQMHLVRYFILTFDNLVFYVIYYFNLLFHNITSFPEIIYLLPTFAVHKHYLGFFTHIHARLSYKELPHNFSNGPTGDQWGGHGPFQRSRSFSIKSLSL